MDTKKWYQSKLVWLGIIESLSGLFALLSEYLAKGNYSPSGLMLLGVGICSIIFTHLVYRYWNSIIVIIYPFLGIVTMTLIGRKELIND